MVSNTCVATGTDTGTNFRWGALFIRWGVASKMVQESAKTGEEAAHHLHTPVSAPFVWSLYNIPLQCVCGGGEGYGQMIVTFLLTY